MKYKALGKTLIVEIQKKPRKEESKTNHLISLQPLLEDSFNTAKVLSIGREVDYDVKVDDLVMIPIYAGKPIPCEDGITVKMIREDEIVVGVA